MAAFISFILAHQSGAADPELLHWIKERIDQLFGPGPWAVVAVMGLVVVSIPVFVVVVYILQAKRRAAAAPPQNQDVQKHERVH